ncbi:MAG: C25 family cysteine peptidase, partial [Candidatus Cloacimonetes bacterium]|nr:C25 family cysteine peptidase [Candidatus Cloacimonadota bacterium]
AIAVPVDGDFSFSIENSESNVTPNINLIPSSKLTLDGDEPGYLSAPGFVAYGNRELYPLHICEKGESAFVGNRKFIPLTIYPFQYRAGSKELVIYDQITIYITIHGTKTASKNWQLSPNPLDAESAEFFLNDSSSKAWRLEKQRNSSVTYPKNGVDGVNEIQLIIDSEGLYKIDYQYLMNMITLMADSLQITMNWTPASVDPRYLELTDEFGQVPIHFVGENDASFDPGDYFEFYGDKHNGDTGYMDDYTSENVYTLSLKDNYGARMVVENGGLIVSNIPSNRIPDAYEETVHFEQQYVSDKLGKGWSSSNPNYFREDLWFWKKISAPNLEIIPIELQYPKDTTIRTASAKVSLMGLTYAETLTSGQYDHEASVRLNQAMINTHTWIGQTEKIFSNQSPIPNTFLKHGTNNLYVSLSGSTVMSDREQVMLDYATVTYWREYKTDLDYIKFTKPSNVSNGLFQFELKGFTTPDISVYKIGSSVFNNVQIEPFNLEGIPPWTVTIQDSVSSMAVRYFAVSEAMKKIPKSARLNVPSNLVDPLNSANVVVITVKDFKEAEGTLQLKSIWENDGHSVKVIDVQDIYDEFNHGIVGSEPIKAFITYAYNNWSEPQLTNVIFLGEGVDDTRDNSPARIYNLVPVKKLWTNKHGATASDNWYACIIGTDSVPDISIARIGVWNPQQILDYADKADSYRNNLQTNRLWNSHLTFTSGGKITDTNDVFAQQSERIRRKSVPKDYRVTRVYTATQQVSSDYSGGTFDLKDAINSGTQYVQFMGHGGGRIWSDYNLFNFNDVTTLNNTTFPIVISLACYASAFDTNGSSSISEALILQTGKGAIGAGGFSGLGYLDQDEGWGLAYTEALFRRNFANLGQATIFALAKFFTNTSSSAARLALTNGYVYLGDPLIKPKKPIVNIPVSAENHTLVLGETLQVHA